MSRTPARPRPNRNRRAYGDVRTVIHFTRRGTFHPRTVRVSGDQKAPSESKSESKFEIADDERRLDAEHRHFVFRSSLDQRGRCARAFRSGNGRGERVPASNQNARSPGAGRGGNTEIVAIETGRRLVGNTKAPGFGARSVTRCVAAVSNKAKYRRSS